MKKKEITEKSLLTFIQEINHPEAHKKIHYLLKLGIEDKRTQRLVLALPEIMRAFYYQLPRDTYRFSPLVTVFLMCCEQHFDLLELQKPKKLLDDNHLQNELFSFLNRLYKSTFHKRFQNTLKQLQEETDHNFQECYKYVNDLFSKYSKLIVLRVDLHYKANVEADFFRFKSDFRKFKNNARHNHSLRELVGYIFKIEYGLKKKLHSHALLFFNGQERDPQKHVNLAKKVGEYWRDVVTQGDGDYFNCNDIESTYTYPALGCIQHFDDKRNNLPYVLEYLCKKKMQFVKPISHPNAKTITKGTVKLPRVPRGKPRSNIFVESPLLLCNNKSIER
jgi:hypothetical protein